MERIGLGKYINIVRKDRGLTSDRLSELCNINATYLRQIESGVKIPSTPSGQQQEFTLMENFAILH